MDEKVIVCAHKWTGWFVGDSYGDWRTCSWCHATHRQLEPEPRVVIGRLEDALPLPPSSASQGVIDK